MVNALCTTIALLLSGLAPLDDGRAQPLEAPAAGARIPIDDKDGRSLDAFHRALRRTAAGKGKTRILQFGASHTAADIFTARIRKRLQARFGDGGHGFFMPARPWKTYRHQNLRFENPKWGRWKWSRVCHERQCHDDGLLGIAGMSVEANTRKQWARFATRYRTKGSSLELWFERQPKGGDLFLKVDRRKRRRVRTRGRSGVGIFRTTFEDGPHTFHIKPRGNGPVRLYGAAMERKGPGVVLDTLGINGARAVAMLDWNYRRWAKLVRHRDPALIVLAYGTNESGDKDEPIGVYEGNLRKVLKRVRRAAPDASCVLFGPTDRPHVHRKSRRAPANLFTNRVRTDLIIQTQRKVAKEVGCGFYDAVAATGGRFSIVSWADRKPRLAYGDYVHLTSRGYRLVADLFLDALLVGLNP